MNSAPPRVDRVAATPATTSTPSSPNCRASAMAGNSGGASETIADFDKGGRS